MQNGVKATLIYPTKLSAERIEDAKVDVFLVLACVMAAGQAMINLYVPACRQVFGIRLYQTIMLT